MLCHVYFVSFKHISIQEFLKMCYFYLHPSVREEEWFVYSRWLEFGFELTAEFALMNSFHWTWINWEIQISQPLFLYNLSFREEAFSKNRTQSVVQLMNCTRLLAELIKLLMNKTLKLSFRVAKKMIVLWKQRRKKALA